MAEAEKDEDGGQVELIDRGAEKPSRTTRTPFSRMIIYPSRS
jgi:hypothetical protein